MITRGNYIDILFLTKKKKIKKKENHVKNWAREENVWLRDLESSYLDIFELTVIQSVKLWGYMHVTTPP